MKSTRIFLIIIGATLLFSTITSATPIAQPGDFIPLRIDNYIVDTDGLPVVSWFTGDWKPGYVKYYLVDPYGDEKFMVNQPIDSVIQSGTNWILTDNSGVIEVPAFATTGMWIIKAKIYDVNKIFIIEWNNKIIFNAYSFHVDNTDATRNLFAPVYIYYDFGNTILTGDIEFAFATPDIIILLVILVVIFLVIINLRVFISNMLTRKK